MAFRFRAEKAGLKRDVAGFGQDEFFEFEINPRDWKMSEGGLGEIVSESFNQFTLFGLGGLSEELAEVEVVEGLLDVVSLSGFFQIVDGNGGGAEKFLRFGSFLVGHADPAEEFQINKGKSWGHG